jgi:4-hydroxy-2-oxoheptanedioate aldolase
MLDIGVRTLLVPMVDTAEQAAALVDLAASMGHRGNPGHPEVQAAIGGAIRTIQACGKAAGTLTGDPAMGRHYLSLGARFVAVGIDVSLLAQATRKLARDFGLGIGPVAAPSSGPY